MEIKKYKPTSPGRRFMTQIVWTELSKKNKRDKNLIVSLKKTTGRNNQGKITIRHRGGGAKRLYRIIDFKRQIDNVKAVVKRFEYDPYRNATIAKIYYENGKKSYILACDKLKINDIVISGDKTKIIPGNCCNLRNIPPGTFVHNVELNPMQGGKLARSAGTHAKLLGFDEKLKYAIIQLSSGEKRMIPIDCRATIGEVGNKLYNLINWGKAGRIRWKRFRPTVRGSVMNPNDHPHGGGEGKTGIGHKSPLSPWGKPTLGYKTRNKKRYSTKYIISKRITKRRKK